MDQQEENVQALVEQVSELTQQIQQLATPTRLPQAYFDQPYA